MRYRIRCSVYEGGGEEDYYEMFASTLGEAEQIAEDKAADYGDGQIVDVEIIDRNIMGRVLPGSQYAMPAIVYVDGHRGQVR